MAHKQIITKVALISRGLLLLLQYVSNIIIPDHNPDVFKTPRNAEDVTILDRCVTHFLSGFIRWDAQYFLHLSKYGYTYENSLAFFPLYPITVSVLARIVNTIIPALNLDSSILLVSVGINILFFVLSALTLYELSVYIVKKDLAYKAAVLFCFNPASVFFSAPYTECLFSYLSFKSMLNCVILYKQSCDVSHLKVKEFVFIIPICLSTLTRSNGVLNIGFLAYILICLYIRNVNECSFTKIIYKTVSCAILMIFLATVCLIPFIAFQIFCYNQFCTDFKTSLPEEILLHAQANGFVLPGTFSQHNQTWCWSKIPLAYSYVQDYYWNVGFLKYYELKQTPQFIVALPVLYLVLKNAYNFLRRLSFRNLFHFDLNAATKVTFNSSCAVFVLHATALTIFCIFNIHIQVATRMLCSASPLVYWFAASYIKSNADPISIRNLKFVHLELKECLILSYFISYFILGTVLFCNYLPWT